jgi:long-chain fatty acid transport protein
MKRVLVMSVAVATALSAGGYKIPEKSVNAVALCAANVANAHGADMAFYNPANMVWSGERNVMEMDLLYVHLPPVTYDADDASTDTIKSKAENFFIPTLYYVSPDLGGWRTGLTILTPVGLAKRWQDQPGKTYSHEFSLRTVEVAPSVAYAVDSTLSVAAGLRMVYSNGVVRSAYLVSRDLEGSSVDFGYNLAVSYRPDAEWKFALTYRSNIDLTEEGDAKLYSGDLNANYGGTKVYDGEAEVSVPIPAALNLAAAWSVNDKTTLEFVLERTFWSSYKELDFDYAGDLSDPLVSEAFDDPIPKDWEDVNAYRLGVTHRYDDQWTAMAGLVYDESPIPDSSLGFETPDSDSITLGLGGRYRVDADLSIGFSGLYSYRMDRELDNDHGEGTFEDSRAIIISAGAEYRF